MRGLPNTYRAPGEITFRGSEGSRARRLLLQGVHTGVEVVHLGFDIVIPRRTVSEPSHYRLSEPVEALAHAGQRFFSLLLTLTQVSDPPT